MNAAGGSAGAAGRASRLRLPDRRRAPEGAELLPLVALAVLGFLVVYPLYWIVEGSLRTSILDATHTFEWYRKVFAEDLATTLRLFGNTLVLAGGGTAMALVVGTAVALLIARTDMPGRGAFRLVFMGPFFLTPMITAVCWSLLASPRIGLLNAILRPLLGMEDNFGPLDIYSMPGMIWVLGLYLTPYVFLSVAAALRSIDPTLEEASRMSGCSASRTLFLVTLPLIRPAILGAALLAFVLGLGIFGIPAILGIPARSYVLTTAIYSSMAGWPANREYACVLSLVLLIASVLAVSAQRRALGGRSYTTVTARGSREANVELGRWRWPVGIVAWIAAGFLCILPLSVLLYAAFATRWTASLRTDLMTLRNFERLPMIEPNLIPALRNSALLAALSATVVVVIAVLLGRIILRRRDIVARLVEQLAMLPVGLPGMVFAVGLLAAYIRPPLILYGTPYILLVAYVTLFLPVGVRASTAALRQLDPALEEAGRMSGAGALRRIFDLVAPLIRPGMLAAWALIFVTLMKEFSSSVLLGSPAVPVNATVLWNLWTLGNYGALAAFEVINTALMATIAGAVLALGSRRRPGRLGA